MSPPAPLTSFHGDEIRPLSSPKFSRSCSQTLASRRRLDKTSVQSQVPPQSYGKISICTLYYLECLTCAPNRGRFARKLHCCGPWANEHELASSLTTSAMTEQDNLAPPERTGVEDPGARDVGTWLLDCGGATPVLALTPRRDVRFRRPLLRRQVGAHEPRAGLPHPEDASREGQSRAIARRSSRDGSPPDTNRGCEAR